MPPFDRPHTISYSFSIATVSASRTVPGYYHWFPMFRDPEHTRFMLSQNLTVCTVRWRSCSISFIPSAASPSRHQTHRTSHRQSNILRKKNALMCAGQVEKAAVLAVKIGTAVQLTEPENLVRHMRKLKVSGGSLWFCYLVEISVIR